MKKHIYWGIFFLSIIFVIGIIRSVKISTYNLECSYYQIESEKIDDALRIVQLSDLHNSVFGNGNAELINMVSESSPDIIVITGDLLNCDESDTSIGVDLIEKLADLAPVYFSYGNHEKDYEKSVGEDLAQVFTDAGATVLDREYVDIVVDNQNIRVGGVYGYCLPERYSDSGGFDQEEYDFLVEFQDTEDYKILLSHLPTPWIEYGFYDDWDIDCIFTGHVHGGQIIIPFIGGLYAPDFGWFPGNLSGIYNYEDEDMTVVLSRGLGNTESIPRFNNIPEIVLVDLKPVN